MDDNRDYDLLKPPDGSPMWREHVVGLLNAGEKLEEFASTTPNECYAMHLHTKEIVARVNVKDVEDEGCSSDGTKLALKSE